jgi:hypothetical protein
VRKLFALHRSPTRRPAVERTGVDEGLCVSSAPAREREACASHWGCADMSIPFKPLPCPFCGGTEIDVQQGSTFRWLIVACEGCGAQCGEVRVQTMGAGTPREWADAGEALAFAEWNKRA